MKFVVDTNIIFSLFKSKSFTGKLLKEYKIELFAPLSLLNELFKYSKIICSKSKITKEEFSEKLYLLPEFIEFKIPSHSFTDKASELISHKTDVLFLALALELNIPIWSNDEHFKEQSSIKVFNTKELKEFLDE